jgi:hypothetical protein
MSQVITKQRIENYEIILFDSFEDWFQTIGKYDPLAQVCVPRKTYKQINLYQIVVGGHNWQFKNLDEAPVIMKGVTECRIAKWSCQSYYLNSVWERYIRMKKLTCVDFVEWNQIINKLPRPRRYYSHQSIEAAKPSRLCNRFGNVLIKGKSYYIENQERLSIVKDIFNKSKKVKLP